MIGGIEEGEWITRGKQMGGNEAAGVEWVAGVWVVWVDGIGGAIERVSGVEEWRWGGQSAVAEERCKGGVETVVAERPAGLEECVAERVHWAEVLG